MDTLMRIDRRKGKEGDGFKVDVRHGC